MLTDEQDQIIKRLQARALKNIYRYKDSYAVMRQKAGVTTHRARRIELCDKFAQKLVPCEDGQVGQTWGHLSRVSGEDG